MTKTIRLGLTLVLLPLSPSFAAAQATAQPNAPGSAPAHADSPRELLAKWRAAVLSGDAAALAAFYSVQPPAQAKTPQGQSQDPSEEPQFWSALHGKGLTNFDVKVLDVEKVRPGIVALVLRPELSIKSDSGAKDFVVSMGQFWMLQGESWRIVGTQRGDLAPAPQMRLSEPTTPNVDLYPPPEGAQSEIDSALGTAGREHKRVILVFGANWCFDCHVLDTAFKSPKIAPLVDANYVIVHVSIGDAGDKNLDLAKRYDTPLDKGVPALAVLDADGKVVFSQKSGEFESSARLGPEDVVQFLDKWKPPHGQ
jgi:thioredoxin 1